MMSLVLAWRLNRGYERWWAARTSLAGVGSSAMVFFQVLATNLPKTPEGIELLDKARRFCSIWTYALKQVVTFATTIDPAAAAYLFPEELEVYKSAKHKVRQLITSVLLQVLAESNLDNQRYSAASQALQRGIFSQGDCVRIKFQAMPQSLTSATTGFVLIWCTLLPFGIITWTNNTVYPIDLILVGIIALLLLSLDEVAAQLEDPFELMPLEEICSAYERDINKVTTDINKMAIASRAGYDTSQKAAKAADPVVQIEVDVAKHA